jgi:hypothetical protein
MNNKSSKAVFAIEKLAQKLVAQNN